MRFGSSRTYILLENVLSGLKSQLSREQLVEPLLTKLYMTPKLD